VNSEWVDWELAVYSDIVKIPAAPPNAPQGTYIHATRCALIGLNLTLAPALIVEDI
jgi:hypothetical protein